MESPIDDELVEPMEEQQAPIMDDLAPRTTRSSGSSHTSPTRKRLKPSSSTSPSPAASFFVSGKQQGICRVEVARVEWNMTAPWQRLPQSKSSGTAFCIPGRRLLTNAHVVRSAVDIRVRPHGSTRRYAAHVAVYAPDVDLALLEISSNNEREVFFGTNNDDNDSPLALEFTTELPSLQESIHVVGFPT
eukprot:scaffold5478_cov161-Amphora_coffeaeformis.AAC.1